MNERIRGTLVVNGDPGEFDEVKYVVANEDSFYYALHKRQEVRNALASRGVYEFADMPKFGLEPKSPLDLRRLGVPDDATLRLGEGSGVAGFKAMLYQDYITGDRQYVLAFAGTDDNFGQLLDWLLFGAEGDWQNNYDQGEQLAKPLRADRQHRREADRRVHRVAAAHPVPEAEHGSRVDPEGRDKATPLL